MKKGDIIFLSASVPHRPQWTGDARPTEIEEAIISIARAVFARQGRLLFGGHPSVSPLIASVASEYFGPDPSRIARPVVTFQSKFFEGRLPDQTWEMVRMGWSAIEWTEKRAGDASRTDQEASLFEMRNLMLLAPQTPDAIIRRNALEPPQAMIVVGGMEGVCDEAAMFLRHREAWRTWGVAPEQRVYAFKSGGGAAARLLDPELLGARLWPEKAADPRDLATLRQAWDKAEIVDVEQRWWEESSTPLRSPAYQPYAAMAQWVLDVDMARVRAR
jgi:SLOG cluster3 family